MTGELKKYEAIFRQKMPGQVKENEYTIRVSADNPIDAQVKATEEWKKMLEDTIKELDKYEEVFGPITREQAALEKRNDLIAEARKLMEDQIPVVEKLRAKFMEAQEAGLTGEELESFRKAYEEAKATQDAAIKTTSQDTKLSGAATAGSTAAYSIIANAQASQSDKLVPGVQILTKEAKSQTAALNKLVDQPFWRSTFAANVHLMKL